MTTLGLVFAGDPEHPQAWSGIPYGLTRALRDLGVAVSPVSAMPLPARLVKHPRLRGLRVALATAAVRRRLHREFPLDGVIQMGTEFTLEHDGPFVTFEDMTVLQACSVSGNAVRGLSDRAIAAWVARQREAYERAIGCCVASRWAASSIIRDYEIPARKVHVVGFGRNHSPALEWRDWSKPRFLFVGREWKRKNGPAVLRAFRAVRADDPHAELHLVGEHPIVDADGVVGHGPMRFWIPSERKCLEALFESVTCLVMPSRYEPFGIAYLEAAAAGVPSIGSTVGCAREIIGEDGGLLVDPDDDRALIAAMRRLSAPSVGSRMGIAARRHARSFTWEQVARRVIAVFEDSDRAAEMTVTLPRTE